MEAESEACMPEMRGQQLSRVPVPPEGFRHITETEDTEVAGERLSLEDCRPSLRGHHGHMGTAAMGGQKIPHEVSIVRLEGEDPGWGVRQSGPGALGSLLLLSLRPDGQLSIKLQREG